MTASSHPTTARLRRAADAPRPTVRAARAVGATATATRVRAHAPRIRGWASTERVPAGRAARTSEHDADQRMAGGARPADAG